MTPLQRAPSATAALAATPGAGRAALRATSPSLDSWRARAVRLELAGVGRLRADAASARARVCVDAPDLENMLPPLRRRQTPARSAVRVPLAGSASTTLASAHGSALTASAETGCACVGERVPDSATSTNARCPPGVVNEHALSTTKRKREMSRGPFGSSWIAKSWPSRRQA